MEPSPRAIKFVSKVFLPKYGWKHELAGIKYPPDEMSFRQTINGLGRTDRGFGIIVDHQARKIVVSFDSNSVSERHSDWLKAVEKRIGLGEIDPQLYWGFDDIIHKLGTKLHNCFYARPKSRKRAVWNFFATVRHTCYREYP